MTKQLQSEVASAPTTSFAARYNRIDKFTEEFAETLVKLSGISHSTLEPLVVFDNACGTGAVSKVLAQTLGRETDRTWRLTCGDTAETMLAYTQ
ncbi:hypothetical protein MAP00_004194 [Monascus purpureus]|nr:hypothetical protein MAP00_004194 [Monascus purpureus]